MSNTNPVHRVVLVGDTCVGKTCLVHRLKENNFEESVETTVAADVTPINTKYDDKPFSFTLCDTAGQEKYRSLAPIYFRGADIAFIVYDITNCGSFKSVETWYKIIQTTSKDIKKIILIGNKRDLIDERTVSTIDAQDLACRLGFANYIEVSCKTGEYMTELLYITCQQLLELEPNTNTGSNLSANNNSKCC